ncbi:MAG: hypothetical protein ED557_09600 [Balneola sp.]|nr:MAG: hypothetical protein ED557_09600 [Balneola sp.]
MTDTNKKDYFDRVDTIVALVREQEPDLIFAIDALQKLERKTWVRRPHIRFKSIFNKTSKHKDVVCVTDPKEGEIIIFIDEDDTVSEIEYISRLNRLY